MGKLFALSVVTAATLSSNAWGAAFDSCPAQAFLTQGTVPTTYAVNLVTGGYRVIADDMGTRSSVNGLGFNPEDQFIYGWSYEHKVPARIHSDFSVEPLPVDNIANQNFYVGDVSAKGSKYYVYRRGASFGLYVIDLDPASESYLQMSRIIDGSSLNLYIADFAVNPNDGFAYTIDSRGDLIKIDLTDGSDQVLAKTGVRGGFGAAYFDPDGNLYLSRNSDGVVFRVAIDAGNYEPVHFANGPSSSINDGSRCALAPVTGESNTLVDFGDAPDSYGTYLDSNGARHGLESATLFFGKSVDGEAEASASPLTDDLTGDVDDEDGVQFATAVTENSQSVALIESSGSGYVSAWVDLDQSGTFDDHEQILFDEPVSAGKQAVYADIPEGVIPGDSWARFRLSSVTGLQPTGGAPDGEVEDFPVNVKESDVVTNYYPSSNGWSTLAFEDNWPYEGDYDMNDLVVYLRSAVSSNASGVKHVAIAGEVAAVGAAYHNGFAIRLPGVSPDDINLERTTLAINGKDVTNHVFIEEGRQEAILIVSYNVWDYVGSGELCEFYRTEADCGSDIQMTFKANIPMLYPVSADLRGLMDPFLFATPGAWHGGHYATAPGRSYEIHTKNQAPTEAFDYSLFDSSGDDATDVSAEKFFQTDKGMPWALEIGTRWQYPLEYRDISHVYKQFAPFATSGGSVNRSWYKIDNADQALVFTY